MLLFMQRQVLGNTLADWLLAALAFVLTFTVLPLLRSLIRRRARRHAASELPVPVAFALHLLQHTSRIVLLTLALYLATRVITLPLRAERVANTVMVLSFWLQVGLWLMAAVRFGLQQRTAEGQDQRLAGAINIVSFVASLVVWSVVLLLALANLGINVTALVAGLGVGGIAIALAVQTVLADLFASLSIALDKPFGVGDLLRIDDCEGVVEQIGIKSTRLRSVSGEQIIIANADLLRSRVRNFQRLQERRALFLLRLGHETPEAALDRLPGLVAEAVAASPGARPGHCLLKALGDSALEFEIVFFVPVRGGNDYALALDAVNRALLRQLRAAGLAPALPAQMLHLASAAPSPRA